MGGAGLNRTYVWLDAHGEICGYFALAPTVTSASDDTGSSPSLLLAKFAISAHLRGSKPKVGPQLLLAAFETVVAAADLVGGRFLVVDTQNDKATAFYETNSFEVIDGTSNRRLIIKISTIRQALR